MMMNIVFELLKCIYIVIKIVLQKYKISVITYYNYLLYKTYLDKF